VLLAHQQSVARLVAPESVGDLLRGNDLALAGLAELASPGPLCCLCPLELGELVEDAVCELSLWALVPTVVKGADLRPMLLELASEEVVIGGLASEAVPILCEHHRHTARSH